MHSGAYRIEPQKTPNPYAYKFVCIPLREVAGKHARHVSREDASNVSALAANLYKVSGVERVFMGDDFITVTRDKEMPWLHLTGKIISILGAHIGKNLPFLEVQQPQASLRRLASPNLATAEIEAAINEVFDRKVRSVVAADGGKLELVEYKDGIAYVMLEGSCTGCPATAITLRNGVENTLRKFVPEVERVERVIRPEQASQKDLKALLGALTR